MTKHHVFFFRHCVRSTDSTVKLYTNDTTTNTNNINETNIPLINFWSSLSQPEVLLPNWNVPQYWCTEHGIQQMYQTGMYIYNTFLVQSPHSSSSSNNITEKQSYYKFRFISDISQRDGDTSLALQEGISYAMMQQHDPNDYNTTVTLSSNVHVTEYVPSIFKPFRATTTMSTQPICNLQVSTQQRYEEVLYRLQTIPVPSISLLETLQLLQVINSNDMNAMSINYTTTVVMDQNHEPQLSGLINVIKLTIQILFYSRAAAVMPNSFLHRITNKQIYTLLPWLQYSRSILNVGTSEAASRGAVLIHTIFDALHISNSTTTTTTTDMEYDDDDHDTVTIFVGHDNDLNAIATVMNVSWEMMEPYNNDQHHSINWYATPPGSAMYMVHDIPVSSLSTNNNSKNHSKNNNDTIVSMSYIYPIFDLNSYNGTIQSWQQTPLVFDVQPQPNNINNQTFWNDTTNTTNTTNTTTTQMTSYELQQQIHHTIQQYIGAMDCYTSDTGLTFSTPPPIPTTNTNTTNHGSNDDVTANNNNHNNHTNSSNNPIGMTNVGGTSIEQKDNNTSNDWMSGFGTGVAVSFVLILSVMLYKYRQQQTYKRSLYSSDPISSIELNAVYHDDSKDQRHHLT